MIDQQQVIDGLQALAARPKDSHKGHFGTIIVLGGRKNMIGAPAMTATAAFRSGAGLVKLAVPDSLLIPTLQLQPSATGIPLSEQSYVDQDIENLKKVITSNTLICVGPGWGSPDTYRKTMLSELISLNCPMVIDADGLNALSEIKWPLSDLAGLDRTAWMPAVLTPHPGEMARLLMAAELESENIKHADDQLRISSAVALSQYHRCAVILKGHRTVVAMNDLVYLNRSGHPAMATAGSGDILTGVLGAVLNSNQRWVVMADWGEWANTFHLRCCMSVYWHGKAGEYWANHVHGERPLGLTALDLAESLPRAILI